MLFVGDPHLGPEGARIVRRFVPSAVVQIWRRGDSEEEGLIRRRIRARGWSVAISFYSDLILTAEDLAVIELPLNIHPALPSVPGAGYDVIPILECHRHYGSTLHRMTEAVDAGEIFDVIEHTLPRGIDPGELRRRNQAASLEMLARWIPRLAARATLHERLEMLRPPGALPRTWSERRCTWARARLLLRDLLPASSHALL